MVLVITCPLMNVLLDPLQRTPVCNPAVHGIVLTSQMIVPNFSWTPHLVLTADNMAEVVRRQPPHPGCSAAGNRMPVEYPAAETY